MNNYNEVENMVRKITKEEAAGITPDSSGVQDVLRRSKRRSGNGYRVALVGGVAVIAALGFAVYPRGSETISQVPDAAGQVENIQESASDGQSSPTLESETAKQLTFIEECMTEKGFSLDKLRTSDINTFGTPGLAVTEPQAAFDDAIGTGSNPSVVGSCVDDLNINSAEGILLFAGKIDGELSEDVPESDLLENYPPMVKNQAAFEAQIRERANEPDVGEGISEAESTSEADKEIREDGRSKTPIIIDFISEQDDLSLDTKAKAIAIFEYHLKVDKAQGFYTDEELDALIESDDEVIIDEMADTESEKTVDAGSNESSKEIKEAETSLNSKLEAISVQPTEPAVGIPTDVLEEIVAAAEQLDVTVEVEGHTDVIGNAEANLELSVDFARTVASSLVELGIAEDDISFTGKGAEEAQFGKDASLADLRKDRRIQIDFQAKSENADG